MKRLARVGGAVFCIILLTGYAVAEDMLATQFKTPPAESRMATYWWIFGPAWTKPEISRELNVLKKAGIGRVLIYPLYPYELDNPAQGIVNQKYLSPQFLDTLRYALATANGMGIATDLVMGTGWPYGGPQIPASMSPKRIFSETMPINATAGQQVSLKLQIPADAKLIAVQLVPKDPMSHSSPIDLTGKASSGSVTFTQADGDWVIMTFLEGPTQARHTVVFAAAGAGGNVIDHLSKAAVDLYLKTVCDKLATAGRGYIRAMYSPSFEVYGINWTDDFLAEFQRRRGYDLRPHLSALFRIESDTPSIRYDYWQTVSDLANENYLGTISQWTHAHGFRFQSESYGEPPVTQSSYSFTDFPMGEEYDWKEFNMVRWTSSAAHFFNHPIISDEAYTWLDYPSRYDETLQNLKRTSDAIFVSGANRLVAHGYAYSPPSAGSPGWGYFAGAMLTEHQPWWPYFHYLSSYVHRTGFLLSKGAPVSDVLVYLPESDLYAEHAPGRMELAWWVEGRLDRHHTMLPDYGISRGVFDFKSDLVNTIISNGYSFDGIDHSVIAMTGTIEGGHFHIGQGNYSIMILPGLTGLPLPDLERIEAFCLSGGTLITTLRKPEMAYGYKGQKQAADHFRAISEELYGGMDAEKTVQSKRVGKGHSIFVADETDSLRTALKSSLTPDISSEDGLSEVGFVHRHTMDHDIYFLANFTTRERHLDLTFRTGTRTPEFWNPMTGSTQAAKHFSYDRNRTSVDLALEPYGSTFVVFRTGYKTPAPVASTPLQSNGPTSRLIVKSTWSLKWDGVPSEPVRLTQLRSWTEFPQAKYFSGRATYETTVEIPAGYLSSSAAIQLEMGDVRNTAEVWINGHPVGVAWKIPYVLDVTKYLRTGENRVRIDVTNLLINQVLNQPTKDYSRLEQAYPGLKLRPPQEKEFVKSPLPSGLLGPVALEKVQH